MAKHQSVMPCEGNGKFRMKAASLAIRFRKQSVVADYENVRDLTDLATGGEMDCVELDILSSMVLRRLKDAYTSHGEQ